MKTDISSTNSSISSIKNDILSTKSEISAIKTDIYNKLIKLSNYANS